MTSQYATRLNEIAINAPPSSRDPSSRLHIRTPDKHGIASVITLLDPDGNALMLRVELV